jgi:hypothetical protein
VKAVANLSRRESHDPIDLGAWFTGHNLTTGFNTIENNGP